MMLNDSLDQNKINHFDKLINQTFAMSACLSTMILLMVSILGVQMFLNNIPDVLFKFIIGALMFFVL